MKKSTLTAILGLIMVVSLTMHSLQVVNTTGLLPINSMIGIVAGYIVFHLSVVK